MKDNKPQMQETQKKKKRENPIKYIHTHTPRYFLVKLLKKKR